MINLDSLPPSAHNLDLGPILARAEAASDAYFDHLAPRCSYTSAGDGMGCGLSSGHDGPHVMLIPRADGWRYVNEARTDIPALCAEVARLRAALSWQESRHGTQAEQEREEAETAAELEAIDAMSEEQVAAELREAGIDVEAGRETCEALVRVALERNRLVDVAREGRAFTAALSKLLGDAGLLEDGPIHEAHLTAVRKLIERIASLETAASAVVEATASKPALVRITTTISPDGVYASGVMTARMPAETGDCRTCAHGLMCPFLQRSDVRAWVTDHTEDDARTRLPDSPSCPCYRAKETM